MVITVCGVTNTWRVYLPMNSNQYDDILICDKCRSLLIFPHTMSCMQPGQTALHQASMYGNPEVVKLLLQSHADVNIKDNVSTESPQSLTPYSIDICCLIITITTRN